MEDRLYKKLKRATPGYHWQRHEDIMSGGISDCSYGYRQVAGWIELKTYDNWPVNPDKPLPMHDCKKTQKNWTYKRGKACGRAWWLIQVGDDWLLIDWTHSRRMGKMTRKEMLDCSTVFGAGPISKRMAEVLTEAVVNQRED